MFQIAERRHKEVDTAATRLDTEGRAGYLFPEPRFDNRLLDDLLHWLLGSAGQGLLRIAYCVLRGNRSFHARLEQIVVVGQARELFDQVAFKARL